jgi:photosystem II stability/assembly factor-like uncharacterized protein
MNDSVTIAGTDAGGVFRSTDKGKTWSYAGLGDATIGSLCIHGSTILAGGDYTSLYRSTDNGLNWSTVDTVTGITALAADGDTFYAGVSTQVHISTDGGVHWEKCARFTETAHGQITGIFIKKNKIMVSTALGNFESTDRGATWSPGTFPEGASCFTQVNDTIFICVSNSVSRSTDNGMHWEKFGSNFPSASVYSLIISGERIFAGTHFSGLFVSPLDNADWVSAGSMFNKETFNCLAAHHDTVIAGTYHSGIFRSTDNGLTWAAANTGLTNTGAKKLMAKDDVVVAAYNLNTGRGIYLTEDGGKHWSYVASEPSQYRVNAFASYDKYIVAGTDSGIYISSDNGVIWTDCTTGIGRITINSLATNGSEIFAGTAGKGIFHSSDHGKQWYNMNYGFTNTNIASLAVFNTQLYVAANTRGVSVSEEGIFVTVWYPIDSGLGNLVPKMFARTDSAVFAGTDYGVYRLKNNSLEWQYVNTGINTSGVTTVEDLIVCNNTLFAAVRGKDVYMSTDDGMTWKGIGSGLITRSFMSLTESKGTLFLGTIGCGIWSRPLSEMIETRSTKKLIVYQPALTTTVISSGRSGLPVTIKFTLSERQDVECSVFDISGRRIATLVNKHYMPGIHRITWDPSNYARGCYIVHTKTGTHSIKKMVNIPG